jgi:hypothetical protein
MNSKKIWAGIFAGAALTVLSACLLPAGDGEGLGPDNRPIVPFVDTNLTYVYNNVFTKHGCTGCHSGSSPEGSMNISSVANARTAFFTINGTDTAAKLTTRLSDVHPRYRVLPGEPDSSMLYQIVSTSDPKGDYPRMPQGGTALTDAKINIIRRWIEKGASLK